MFASGGHAGQVFVVGMPSMRILRSIAVFTPEPWQGWGFGAVGQEEILSAGDFNETEIRWGDTHHPALTETAAEYDGERLFINDKANARLGVIDLRDFETKQIVKNPIAIIDHGGTFVTPNTEYVIEGGQYAQPLGGEYAPLSDYNEKYRGMVTLWKFDQESRTNPHRRVLRDRAAAVLAGPLRRRQARLRGLVLLQLVQHRAGDRRRRGRQPALRGRSQRQRHGLPPRHELADGRSGLQGRQDDRDQRYAGDHAGDGDRRGPPVRSSPSRRARTAPT